MANKKKLKDKKVAILATVGFEEDELTSPKKELEDKGATVHIVSDKDKLKSWVHTHWGDEFNVDVSIKDAKVHDYDALILPGGVINPDKLRRNESAVKFVKDFMESGKPVASICHGPQMLIEADVVNGRNLTSYHSINTDLKNAGAQWKDEEVVTDQNLITSRNPKDLPAFNNKIIEYLSA
jgi:protease I